MKRQIIDNIKSGRAVIHNDNLNESQLREVLKFFGYVYHDSKHIIRWKYFYFDVKCMSWISTHCNISELIYEASDLLKMIRKPKFKSLNVDREIDYYLLIKLVNSHKEYKGHRTMQQIFKQQILNILK